MQQLYKFIRKTSNLVILLILIFLTSLEISISKVVYTYVDTTLASQPDEFWAEYNIDMNHDGSDEFFLHHAYQGNIVCEIYSNINAFGNEVLVSNPEYIPIVPIMLDKGTIIKEELVNWYDSYNGFSTSAMYFNANWFGQEEKYVGVRFKINNFYHYGWICLSIPADTAYIRIKDFAYDDVALTEIIAGETPTGIKDNCSNPYKVHLSSNKIMIVNLDILNSITKCSIYNVIGKELYSFDMESGNDFFGSVNSGTGIYSYNFIID